MRRIKTFEAAAGGAGDLYREVELLQSDGLEEMSDGEKARLDELLSGMGFWRDDDYNHWMCDVCEGDDPECPAVSYVIEHEQMPFFGDRLEHMVIVTKDTDDYWQVEFFVLLHRAVDFFESRFRCDDWRGVEALLRGHVAAKVAEARALAGLFASAVRTGLGK